MAAKFTTTEWIWRNGDFIPWEEATIHVMSHVVHYGSSVFEGIRCYQTKRGPAIFRLHEHIRRLYDSAKIYRMQIPYELEEFKRACIDIIQANDFDDCYLRPLVYRGFGSLGVFPGPCPVDVMIGAWVWGKYLGSEGFENGVDVRISSWNRMAPNTFPAMAKATANYMNSILIRSEAGIDGYAEGIALDVNGYVSEGSGENVFVVRDNKIITPPLGASVLSGITRDTIMKLAKDLGFEVTEALIPREALYIADELFFTGTAAEITPIREVDDRIVGEGARGPITKELQGAFFAATKGENEKYADWLTYVND